MAIELKNIEKAAKKPVMADGKKTGGTWETITGLLNKDISFSRGGLSDKSRERFYSELNILLASGVDIKTAMDLVEEEQSRKTDRELFSQVKQYILKGGTLSSAMEMTGKFSAYEYFSIRIGEESGRLNEVLEELAKFFLRKINQKRQFVSALSYPAIVVTAAGASVFFMLSFVVPMFKDVFKRFGGELPWLTQQIINASGIFLIFFPYFLFFLIISIVLLYTQRRQEWLRKLSSVLILKIPVAGEVVRKLYLARLCSSVNLLLGANTPLINALELIEKMVSFYPIEKSLRTAREKVLKGKPLHQSLSGFSIYDHRMISLIKVAEEVNQLDIIFGKLAKQYTDDAEHRTSMLGSTIEPVLIICIGLFVAVILIAMYLPLFQLGTMVK